MPMPIDFKALANPAMRTLLAYDPGHDVPALRKAFAPQGGLLELGSNENSLGPSPDILPSLMAELDALYRYPDPTGKDLKQAIAGKHGVSMESIALGNGSHELLMQLAQVFAGPDDEVLVSRYCFAVYPIAAQSVAARLVVAEPNPPGHSMPLGHDLDALLACVTAETKLVFFANPNNPTGTWFSFEELARFMASVPEHVLVVADEAYIDYVTEPAIRSALSLSNDYPNLIVTRTFSKAYGLAALRAGYAVAHPDLIRLMEPIRESFNLNALALQAARIALSDDRHLAKVKAENAIQRDRLTEDLRALGITVLPSQTNFVLAHFGDRSDAIENALFRAGVMVRPMKGYGLGDYLRITVGTDAENRRFIEVLSGVMA